MCLNNSEAGVAVRRRNAMMIDVLAMLSIMTTRKVLKSYVCARCVRTGRSTQGTQVAQALLFVVDNL